MLKKAEGKKTKHKTIEFSGIAFKISAFSLNVDQGFMESLNELAAAAEQLGQLASLAQGMQQQAGLADDAAIAGDEAAVREAGEELGERVGLTCDDCVAYVANPPAGATWNCTQRAISLIEKDETALRCPSFEYYKPTCKNCVAWIHGKPRAESCKRKKDVNYTLDARSCPSFEDRRNLTKGAR